MLNNVEKSIDLVVDIGLGPIKDVGEGPSIPLATMGCDSDSISDWSSNQNSAQAIGVGPLCSLDLDPGNRLVVDRSSNPLLGFVEDSQCGSSPIPLEASIDKRMGCVMCKEQVWPRKREGPEEESTKLRIRISFNLVR